MKTILRLSILLLLSSTTLIAQNTEFKGIDFEKLNLELEEQQQNYSFKESLRFGGGFGLGFGNDFFSASITPFVLSEVNQYLLTGVGLNFTYSSFDNEEAIVYGGSLIVIGQPIRELQLSVEYEQLRVNRTIDTRNGTFKDDYWVPALFLGIGYSSGPVTFGIRWDVLYDNDKSIYADSVMPFVRFMF